MMNNSAHELTSSDDTDGKEDDTPGKEIKKSTEEKHTNENDEESNSDFEIEVMPGMHFSEGEDSDDIQSV